MIGLFTDESLLQVFYVVRERLVGIAVVSSDEEDELELEYICGRGYGAVLLQAVEEYAQEEGFDYVTLTSANDSEEFYRRHGYEPGYYQMPSRFVKEIER